MDISGKIKLINETKTFGSNGFRKRDMVITTEDQYPQMILIEFIQDKCDVLNSFNVGQDVKIYINIQGREWINPEGEAKYFNSIQGWKIEAVGAGAAPANVAPATPDLNAAPAAEAEDDLPF
ncbi:MAG: DUF3127 domain-containing protein [Flavobacteriaceae bacterium]|nr:DUF3127 domain-containing protein [Flavobacteriaceae bacterium]